MLTFWLKVAGIIVAAGFLAGAGAVINHEVQLSGIEKDIHYIQQSQKRIEKKLNTFLGECHGSCSNRSF
jgi:hypothetical protein